MPRKRSNFHRLLDLSEKQLEQKADALRSTNKNLQQAKQQLQLLELYRKEYSVRLLNEGKNACSTINYRNFHRFIGTLDHAITEQNKTIESLLLKRKNAQKQWKKQKQRSQAYQMLINREQKAAEQQAQKIEQQLNDELATQLFRQNKAPLG